MPNTLTTIFTSTPASEPVESPHPNTGAYVLGTQLGNGTWQVVHTLVTKTSTPPTVTGRLKNFPAVAASVVASGNVLNNILATPTGTSAVASSATAINATVSSNPNATAYRLLSAATAGGTYAQIYQGAAAGFAHTGLTASTAYYYQWQYVGGGYYDDSALSGVFSAATTAVATNLNDFAVLIVGDSTATANNPPGYPLQGTLVASMNAGIANGGHTGSFTSIANTAVSGQALTLNPDGSAGGLIGNFASQVAGRYVAGKYNVIVIVGVLNSLSNEVASGGESGAAARVLASMKQYIQQVRADNPNWAVVIASDTKRTNGPMPGTENQRPILNQSLFDGRTGGTLDAAAVAFYGADTRLRDPGPAAAAGTLTPWFVDQVHYTQQSVETIVAPSLRDAFLFARYGTPQPAPYTGTVAGSYIPGAQKLAIVSQTGGIAELGAVGSGVFTVPAGGSYGNWTQAAIYNLLMPAVGTSQVGVNIAATDALNTIIGLTYANVRSATAQTYQGFDISFYRHEDGYIRYSVGAATAFVVGPKTAVGDLLFFKKTGNVLSIVKTSDGGTTYATLVTLSGTYSQDMYVQVAMEPSLGKFYSLQGLGLTATPTAGAGTTFYAKDAALQFIGTWATDSNPAYYSSANIGKYTTTLNDYVGLTGNYSKVEFWSPKLANAGNFQVQVNGAIGSSFSENSATTVNSAIICTITGPAGQSNSFTFQNKQVGGTVMVIDKIVAYP